MKNFIIPTILLLLVSCTPKQSWELTIEDDIGKQFQGKTTIHGEYFYEKPYENNETILYFQVETNDLELFPESIQEKEINKFAILNPEDVFEAETQNKTTITIDQINLMSEGPAFLRITSK